MHAISHSLAHRAPPASRTRVRWQPYNNSSIPTPNFCLLTPSSVSSNSSPATPACETARPKLPSSLSNSNSLSASTSLPNIAKDSHVRDASKHKYALGLVDQAVKSLTEIWPTHQIPCVFTAPSRVSAKSRVESQMKPKPLRRHNTQLPSPVSPSTRPSPAIPPATLLAVPGANSDICDDSQSSLVPIKAFVHEVLRRSRTSGGILQTALCYLEAIRHQVPELAKLEQQGLGVKGEPELASRIIQDEACMSVDESFCTASVDAEAHTVRVSEICIPTASLPHKPIVSDLPALPPLPSPLLCPRRAFIASLILASKFTQDKCYSNRAWAKLSGLPPREIGRCERALGEALDWRLWVGKAPEHNSSRTPIQRAKSEGHVLTPAAISTPSTTVPPMPLRQNSQSGLRRCTTLPVEAYEIKPSWPEPYTVPEPAFSASHASSSTCSRESSPAYSTPGLSYSPTSTESSSSSGDQTIQSGFIEDNFGSGMSINAGENIAEMETAMESQANWPWHPSHADYSQHFNTANAKFVQPFPPFVSESGFSGFSAHY